MDPLTVTGILLLGYKNGAVEQMKIDYPWILVHINHKEYVLQFRGHHTVALFGDTGFLVCHDPVSPQADKPDFAYTLDD